MNLFIDTISKEAIIILFDNNKKNQDNITWNIKGNESSTLIPKIDELLKNNNIRYNDLKNIVVVNGPGSFTGVRTIVLATNSINYIIKKNMTALSFFDLHKNYPIIKASSKRDCFVKRSLESKVEIILNEDLINEGIDIEKVDKVDYQSIINNVKFDNKKQLKALYIKKPNIS